MHHMCSSGASWARRQEVHTAGCSSANAVAASHATLYPPFAACAAADMAGLTRRGCQHSLLMCCLLYRFGQGLHPVSCQSHPWQKKCSAAALCLALQENDGSSSSGRGAASSSGNSRGFQFGSSSFFGRSLSFDVVAAAAQLPGNLAQRIGADIAPESAGGAPNLYTDNDATDRLESAELFFMLSCNLALEASRLHHAKHGQQQPAEQQRQQPQNFLLLQQQQQPEAHHQLLLGQLRVGWLQQQLGTAAPAAAASASQQQLAYVELLHHVLCGRADEDSAVAGAADGFWGAAVAGILVLLQHALLQGSSSAAERLQQLLQCSRTVSELVGDLQCGLAQALRFETAEAKDYACLAQLQEAVLLELAPAVQRCVADVAAESAAAGDAAAAAASASAVLQLQHQLCDLLVMDNFPLPRELTLVAQMCMAAMCQCKLCDVCSLLCAGSRSTWYLKIHVASRVNLTSG